MKRNNFKTFLIAFLILFSMFFVSAYTNVPSSSATNTPPPMDNSTDVNHKDAGLSVTVFTSGGAQSSMIYINNIGNIGIKTTPTNDVRLYVNGDVKISSLAGSGNKALCVGSGNQLVRCQ